MYRVVIHAADSPEYVFVGSDFGKANEVFRDQTEKYGRLESHEADYYGATITLEEFPDGGFAAGIVIEKWEWTPTGPDLEDPSRFKIPDSVCLDYRLTEDFVDDIRVNGIKVPVTVNDDFEVIDGALRVIAAFICGYRVPYRIVR